MKKAQTEIIGLAVVVIIISIGLIFLTKLQPTQSETPQDLRDTKLASNMLSVMLRTDSGCRKMDVKSLLQACAEGATTINYCGTYYPCDLVNGIIVEMLTDTLEAWNRDYYFSATLGDNPPLIEHQSDAYQDNADRIKEIYIIPTSLEPRRPVTVELAITK